jgi:thiol-disulfide isomerase/thioredoxin
MSPVLRSLLLFLIGCGISSAALSDTIPLPPILQEDSLPWFAARTGENGDAPFTRQSLAELVKPGTKRVALVYFATWCHPCREGIIRLSRQKENLKNQGIMVILVNIGERDLSSVRTWVQKTGGSDWPIVFDFFGRLTASFGLDAEGNDMSLPRILLLDSRLKALRFFCSEGDDWPSVLWEK